MNHFSLLLYAIGSSIALTTIKWLKSPRCLEQGPFRDSSDASKTETGTGTAELAAK